MSRSIYDLVFNSPDLPYKVLKHIKDQKYELVCSNVPILYPSFIDSVKIEKFIKNYKQPNIIEMLVKKDYKN